MENSSNKKDESTYVFDKSMNCPVCDADFKTKEFHVYTTEPGGEETEREF